ncbi:GTPase ObgE [Thermosediminibacter oceani]|uniref:GTPase Obg n=1 Tax=Thermosediminibacter oceani (strain ATCC BAA-1034 / DSM 16646 / JW/IW-1228P) TaxID=555079 RepID=D9S2A6_THEOJ|nr:GTPase ObgE [Thermosediminibacter oceani]ADL07533.1 GTP-binding protein Obg/CgtA [Thermosediminibacter oceani DSM 16646]
MFVDRAKIYVKAGDGGNGVVAFRREKYVPRGGPSGGDGGKGGDVVLMVDSNLSTLQDFKYRAHYKAQRGQNGQGSNKIGKSGEDLVIKVPPGTVVKDAETGEILADLVKPGQTFIAARGGRGGRGNARFVSPVNQAPDFAEKGEPGEERWILLELKLLADVGLIGFPNAGKSTLLSRMTAARPKIADYPFTTLTPNLGVVDMGPTGRSFVVADIPGLIEGAHEGLGLGHEFLRHVERTRVLVHIIDAAGLENDPVEGFYIINRELAAFSEKLAQKPQIVAANKMDLPQARENLDRIKSQLEPRGYEVVPISAATGEGVKELIYKIIQYLDKVGDAALETVEVKKYTIKEEDEIRVERVGDVFQVKGKVIERLVVMTDLDNESAVKRLQQAFKRMGIDELLKEKGIKEGDTVRIGNAEFYYTE